MSSRKFGNSWWVDFYFDRVRHRKRSPQNSKQGADAYEAQLRHKLARGEALEAPVDPEKAQVKLFGDFVPQWVETHVRMSNKLSERITKEIVLRVHLLPWFGAFDLGRITVLEIEKYKAAKLKAGLSPKTINNHVAVLIKCLRCACEWNLIPSVPRMVLLRVPPQDFDFLTPVESARLLQDRQEPMWALMVLLALRTGMRRGELLGLEWSDIDLENRLLTVKRSIVHGETSSPKNNKVRHIPLADDLAQALLSRRRQRGLVFTRPGGGPLTASIAWNALRRLCKRSGTRLLGWHALRHTFASQLAAEDAPLYKVQVLMGHATAQMTARYAHLAPSSLRSVIDLLPAAERREMKLGQQVGNAVEND